MGRKRNFIITQKAIAEYLGLHRNTIRLRLKKANISVYNRNAILDWLVFEARKHTDSANPKENAQ